MQQLILTLPAAAATRFNMARLSSFLRIDREDIRSTHRNL